VAGGKGDTLRNALLDHALGGSTYTQLTNVYIALYTASPTSAGGGTEVSTSSTGYARQLVVNDNTNWGAAASGVKSNLTLIDFGTASGNWGTIVAGTIMSASSGGYILYFGPLTASKTINTNDGFRIPIAGLVLTES